MSEAFAQTRDLQALVDLLQIPAVALSQPTGDEQPAGPLLLAGKQTKGISKHMEPLVRTDAREVTDGKRPVLCLGPRCAVTSQVEAREDHFDALTWDFQVMGHKVRVVA